MAIRNNSGKTLVLVALIFCLTMLYGLVSCSGSEKNGMASDVDAVSSEAAIIPADVSLSDVSIELGYGITRRLNAVGGKEIQWSTSDEKIASVDSEGNVKGVDLGECVITASNEFGKRAQCSVTVKKTCYITVDDGPSSYVNSLLDALKETDAKATFFLVGTPYFPAVKRMADEGHTLALHTYRFHSYRDQYVYFTNLDLLNDRLEEYTGIRSNILRFPGGSGNSFSEPLNMRRVINGAHDLGYRVFDWTCSAGDASGNGSYKKSCTMIRKLCTGKQEIVLFHDKGFTPNVIRTIVPELRERGYVFETLDHCPDDSYEVRCRYSYKNPDLPAEAVAFRHSELELKKGEEYTLKAIMTPERSTDFVVWQSSDESVVKVDKGGKVTCAAIGEAVITARTTSGKTAECKIKVIPEEG